MNGKRVAQEDVFRTETLEVLVTSHISESLRRSYNDRYGRLGGGSKSNAGEYEEEYHRCGVVWCRSSKVGGVLFSEDSLKSHHAKDGEIKENPRGPAKKNLTLEDLWSDMSTLLIPGPTEGIFERSRGYKDKKNGAAEGLEGEGGPGVKIGDKFVAKKLMDDIPNSRIVCRQLPKSRSRTYAVTWFPDYVDMLLSLPPKKRTFNELVGEDQCCRLYLDIDLDVIESSPLGSLGRDEISKRNRIRAANWKSAESKITSFSTKLCKNLIEEVISTWGEAFEGLSEGSEIAESIVMDSSRPNKISKHLIIRFKGDGILFASKRDAGALVLRCAVPSEKGPERSQRYNPKRAKLVKPQSKPPQKEEDEKQSYSNLDTLDLDLPSSKISEICSSAEFLANCLDMGIYKGEKEFRLLECTKSETNVPLILQTVTKWKLDRSLSTVVVSGDPKVFCRISSRTDRIRSGIGELPVTSEDIFGAKNNDDKEDDDNGNDDYDMEDEMYGTGRDPNDLPDSPDASHEIPDKEVEAVTSSSSSEVLPFFFRTTVVPFFRNKDCTLDEAFSKAVPVIPSKILVLRCNSDLFGPSLEGQRDIRWREKVLNEVSPEASGDGSSLLEKALSVKSTSRQRRRTSAIRNSTADPEDCPLPPRSRILDTFSESDIKEALEMYAEDPIGWNLISRVTEMIAEKINLGSHLLTYMGERSGEDGKTYYMIFDVDRSFRECYMKGLREGASSYGGTSEHSSNGIYYVFDLIGKTFYQKCHSPSCEGLRGSKHRLDEDLWRITDMFVLYNHILMALDPETKEV